MTTIHRRTFLKSGAAAVGAISSLQLQPARAQSPERSTPATIYTNGQIVTMEGDAPSYVEAVAVQGEKIIFAGSKQGAQAALKEAVIVDLQGRTMLPGFIDAWGHFTLVAEQTLGVNISYFADKPPRNKADIIALLKNTPPFNGWIIGYGYSDPMLLDGSPTLADLDAAFPNTPVMLSNLSSLTGKVNSAGLAKLGITPQTPAVQPGVIVKDPKTGQLTGELLFTPFLTARAVAIGNYSQDILFKSYRAAQTIFAQQGYTTLQTYQLDKTQYGNLRAACDQGVIALDVMGLPSLSDAASTKIIENPDWTWGAYSQSDRGIKIPGFLVSTDAAPQLCLAAMTKPYANAPGFPKGWKGQLLPRVFVEQWIYHAYANDIQLFCYSNGDAGIDLSLSAIRKAVKATGKTGDRRTVIAHSFFARPDQLASYKKHHIGASMMPLHMAQYGDVMRKVLGPARADLESPAASAIKIGLPLMLHNDCPSASPNVMEMIGAAVTRMTFTGHVMGPSERISPYAALVGVTRNAAHNYREERSKGTIAVGKIADLVILDANPLTVAPSKIKDIKVVETLKRGRTVYRRA